MVEMPHCEAGICASFPQNAIRQSPIESSDGSLQDRLTRLTVIALGNMGSGPRFMRQSKVVRLAQHVSSVLSLTGGVANCQPDFASRLPIKRAERIPSQTSIAQQLRQATSLGDAYSALARSTTLPLLFSRAFRVAFSSTSTSLIEASLATSTRSASSSLRSSRLLRRWSLSNSFLASR